MGQIKGTYGTSRFDYITRGMKFGKWEVIGERMKKMKSPRILCKCECGKEKDVLVDRLDSGTSRGCFSCVRRTQYKLGQTYWTTIVRGAEQRNIKIDITMEEAAQLYIKQNKKCALTGLDIDFGFNSKSDGGYTKEQRRSASLDRIDSTGGYTKDNIQWIHKQINVMKNRFSQEHFIEMCKLVTENAKN